MLLYYFLKASIKAPILMLFYPLYSVAFCKGCNVRCVHQIIYCLIQWLLSKPVINCQIMTCPLLVCFIWCFDWLLWGTECRKTFLKTTTTTTKIIYHQRNFTVWIIPKIDQTLGIYTWFSTSLTHSAPTRARQKKHGRFSEISGHTCFAFIFWIISDL